MWKKSIIFIISIVLCIIIILFFLIEIGIGSKFFIKRDFTTAAEYLLTGDCESFNKYMATWSRSTKICKVISEQNYKIKKIEILNISHTVTSNIAFLQLEYTFSENGKERKIISNGKMQKKYFTWKIIYLTWNSADPDQKNK